MSIDPQSGFRFVIVEDDLLVALALERQITNKFENSLILRVATESSFLQLLELVEHDPPDLIITDMRLRFTDEFDFDKEPPGSATYAGARCIRELRSRPPLQNVPIIVCSVINNAKIESELSDVDLGEIQIISKPWVSDDLIAIMRSLLAARAPLPEPKQRGLISKVWNATDAKLGVGGFRVDLKKVLARNAQANTD